MGQVEAALEQPLILVVDDDRDICETLWDLLHERGYRVCLAHGEAEAAGRLRDRADRTGSS
jgi:two-component system, NtrC family, response regulator HydG